MLAKNAKMSAIEVGWPKPEPKPQTRAFTKEDMEPEPDGPELWPKPDGLYFTLSRPDGLHFTLIMPNRGWREREREKERETGQGTF
jgi:hypothetical protein